MPTQQHIAFFLPQFHPIAENDDWWGPGFTEWTNVAQARPRFQGHYQPHIPADLGFYDLRLPDVRERQAALADQYGIDGFCYYHYWFGDGRRLLERPFSEILDSGRPDQPFCLAWANENWTRRWDGQERAVLMRQDYSGNEAVHGAWLAQAFKDPRYIRFEGKPLFLVYRASDLPDSPYMTRVWRDEAMKAGVGEIFLCRVESMLTERSDPRPLGFDASVEFAPDWARLPRTIAERVRGRLRSATRTGRAVGSCQVYDYREVRDAIMEKPPVDWRRFPCVTPGWDNSPRHRKSLVLKDAHPDLYREWVEWASRRARESADESLVFVNAWNEWGEGAHLEPDLKWGHAFLAAHRAGRAAADAEVDA